MELTRNVAVIIVTHNAESVLPHCLASLRAQTLQPASVVLVDSGSDNTDYLESYGEQGPIHVLFEENIGFSRANNCGYASLQSSVDFVLFLNPDAFPEPESIERAIDYLLVHDDVGCVGGRLRGFDQIRQQPTGLLDSTGVFRKWYGCWYDRGQGKPDDSRYNRPEDVPAVCGAFLACRKTMLDQVGAAAGVVFDPDFFLYKEDIELCLRIRQCKWRIVYLPDVHVYHCRGWGNRRRIPYQQRLVAAGSELLLYRKHPSIYMVWALAKYGLVRWLRL